MKEPDPMRPEPFQTEIEEKIVRLRAGGYATREAELASLRARWAEAWLAEHEVPATPRGAFELFLRDYLGADLATVPVLRESAHRIVWRAQNPCDTLEACQRLGLETRDVCRALYEKPTQWLLSQLDPELRFLRRYDGDGIRPRADACEERIVRVSFEGLMDRALEAARAGLGRDGHGYGALVARGQEVLAVTHDAGSQDPTAHAELRALHAAAERLNDRNLGGCVLVTTCEPCPICAAAAGWANITTLVYGASNPETSERGRAGVDLRAEAVLAQTPTTVELLGGCRETECLALYH